jgi:ribonuclease HI
MVQLLQNRTQPITLYKVRAHVNIDGNEQADKLAKEGLELEQGSHMSMPMPPHTTTKRTFGPQ